MATAQPVADATQMQQFQLWQQEQQFKQFLAWKQQQQAVSVIQTDSSQFTQFQQWQASQQVHETGTTSSTMPSKTSTGATEPTISFQEVQINEKPIEMQSISHQTGAPTSNQQQQATTQSSQQTTTAQASSSSTAAATSNSGTTNSNSNSNNNNRTNGFNILGVLDNATAQINKLNAAQKNTQSKVNNLGKAFQNLVSGLAQMLGACNSDACTSVTGKF